MREGARPQAWTVKLQKEMQEIVPMLEKQRFPKRDSITKTLKEKVGKLNRFPTRTPGQTSPRAQKQAADQENFPRALS